MQLEQVIIIHNMGSGKRTGELLRRYNDTNSVF